MKGCIGFPVPLTPHETPGSAQFKPLVYRMQYPGNLNCIATEFLHCTIGFSRLPTNANAQGVGKRAGMQNMQNGVRDD